jgi:DedD protein
VERATRERLTGAVIFFAVLGIAVPELLSGPGDRAMQEEVDAVAEAGPPLTTYDLAIDPAAARDVARQQALGADSAARSEAIAQAVPPPVTEQTRELVAPPPVASNPAPAPLPEAVAAGAKAGGEDKPAARAPVVVGRPASATGNASASAGAAGQWWVQLGSFSSEANAQRLAVELRGAGFAIQVSKVRASGEDWHRVRAGPAADRGTATALRERLAAAGQQGSLVAP